jgi:hypothetical protein
MLMVLTGFTFLMNSIGFNSSGQYMKQIQIFIPVDSQELQVFSVSFKTDAKLIKSDFPELAKLDLVRVRNTFNTIQYKILIIERRSGRVVASSPTIWDAYNKAKYQFGMAKRCGILSELKAAIEDNCGKMYDDSAFELL